MQSSYWLTRFIFLRLLGLVYVVAFLVLINQAIPLIGEHGITPAKDYLSSLRPNFHATIDAFKTVPTLFWMNSSDTTIQLFSWLGFVLSLCLLFGFANSIILFILWFLYLSFINIGQLWYGYGWEIQLLETGFIAIFLVPLFDLRPFPKTPPSLLIIWLLRWLAFRVNLGSGLIKIRGDSCWKDLTCLDHHFQTQPIPNPLSPLFHFAPHKLHTIGVWWTHVAQLFAPWLVLGPRYIRNIGGIILTLFQFILIISGNFSFFNWVTLTAVVTYFDDGFLRKILPQKIVVAADTAQKHAKKPDKIQKISSFAVFILVMYLSIPVISNLFSSNQAMNTSFDPLHLVNTYGAFGSITRERYELIFEGTIDKKNWKEYEFFAKPGDPHRRLPFVAPYQYHLDWQLWFAAMEPREQNPWILRFIEQLLNNDKNALSLIAHNPFPTIPPKAIRVLYYKYEFAPSGEQGPWKRTLIGQWLPPLSLQTNI